MVKVLYTMSSRVVWKLVPGTKVQVITKGIFGGDPILIQVGFTRFALRKSEAAKIEIEQAVSA